VDEIQRIDAGLVHLAEALGIECLRISLPKEVSDPAEFIEKATQSGRDCLVLNPETIRGWLPQDVFPGELGESLVRHFRFILVHNPQPDALTDSVLMNLSDGKLKSARPPDGTALDYEIAAASEDVCSAFSGIRFGPANPPNDLIFLQGRDAASVRSLISIAGHPFLASLRKQGCDIFFLGAKTVADLDKSIGSARLADFFSQWVPAVMALRKAFGKECWQPEPPYATVVIDDPLLRKDYGFLNYQRLLEMMDEHNFHTSIAFIPINFKRNSAAIVRTFKERSDRLSICFHGNDHIGSEFAATDTRLLNSMLTTAEARMETHWKTTGLPCDKVMVFPQGCFSEEAMSVLNAHNFLGAVNTTPHPEGKPTLHTIGDLLYPSLWKYGGFPLFLRKYPSEIAAQDIALNVFVGKPVLVVEHHEIFKDPQPLIQVVNLINSIVPQMRWSNLQTAVENSYLSRVSSDGVVHIRPASKRIRIENSTRNAVDFSVEWSARESMPGNILADGQDCLDSNSEASSPPIFFNLLPGASRTLEYRQKNKFGLSEANCKAGWQAKAFVRRRLSEMRDNILCKHPRLLSIAKTVLGKKSPAHSVAAPVPRGSV
jgi:hypothetical protein